MKRWLFVLTLIWAPTLGSVVQAEPSAGVKVRRASVSAPGDSDVKEFIAGGVLRARADARFVKLSFVFEAPVEIGQVEVESCADDFQDSAEFYFDPGGRQVFAEGGTKILRAELKKNEASVRTLAVNFQQSAAVCLKALRLLDQQGKRLALLPASTATVAPQDGERDRQASFAKASVTNVLDRELKAQDEKENWLLRLRTDGTFFLRGSMDDLHNARWYSAVGTYEVVESSTKEVRLQLNGIRRATATPWDGEICGEPCGESKADVVVRDVIAIEKWKSNSFMVRNRTIRKSRSLGFVDVRVTLSSLHE